MMEEENQENEDTTVPEPKETGTVIVDGKVKKFNKISRYMLDMLTTED